MVFRCADVLSSSENNQLYRLISKQMVRDEMCILEKLSKKTLVIVTAEEQSAIRPGYQFLKFRYLCIIALAIYHII